MTSSFDFHSRNVFLTFPQCPAEKLVILDYFQQLYPVKEFIVASERHEDGSPHIHLVLQFDKKVHKRQASCFDYKVGDDVFHPNIQRPRCLKNCVAYCKKDGNFLASDGIGKTKKTWGEIRSDASDAKEYLSFVDEHYPRDYALHFEKLKVFADIHYKEAMIPYESPFLPAQFKVTVPEMLNFANDVRTQPRNDPKVGAHLSSFTLPSLSLPYRSQQLLLESFTKRVLPSSG